MKIATNFLVLLAAIHTYAVLPIDTLKADIDGRWEWVQTYGGYAGELYTPQSENYSLALVFSKNEPSQTSDSIGYRVYRNDTLILSGFTTLSSSAVRMQPFGPGNFITGELVCTTDTLLLETFISDGYSSMFVRPKTYLKRNQPFVHVTMPSLTPGYALKQFTLSGRRIDAGRYSELPAQIAVSRQNATVKGIKK